MSMQMQGQQQMQMQQQQMQGRQPSMSRSNSNYGGMQQQQMPQQMQRGAQNPPMDSLEYAMELSKKEMERAQERPGMVKVAGTGRTQGPAIPQNLNRDVTGIPPDSIQMLISMGFSQDQAIHALRQTNHDVAAAADFLLGSM